VLTARMRAAKNRHMEIEWIVADLRKIGHNVKRWEGVIANWDDGREDPFLWVSIAPYDSVEDEPLDDASVGVSFRPRVPGVVLNCPFCWSEMEDREIHLRIQGHGSVDAPAVSVHFECPGVRDLDGPIGIASVERRRNVRVCTACGAGLLLPPPRA